MLSAPVTSRPASGGPRARRPTGLVPRSAYADRFQDAPYLLVRRVSPDYPRWKYYPLWREPAPWCDRLVQVFRRHRARVDSSERLKLPFEGVLLIGY